MAIILPSGFNITNVDPIDSRFTVSNQAARLGFSAANVYEGLVVYQQDTSELYVLTSIGSYNLNAGWSLVGSNVPTGSFATTGSNTFTGDIIIQGNLTAQQGVTGSLFGTASNATNAINATTASFVQIIAGQGISVSGMVVTANVRTVNGVSPDGTGNIPLSLGTVLTGTSASLVVSSSGAVTASIQNATVWIVSGDATPANNGDAYIFNSGSVGQWLAIAPLDEAAGDARYARINVVSTQQLTSSFAVTASHSKYCFICCNSTNCLLCITSY